MNIAVIAEEDIFSGGGFQYSLSTILMLKKKISKQYNFIFFTTNKNNITVFENHGIQVFHINLSKFDKWLIPFTFTPIFSLIKNKLKLPIWNKIDRVLTKHDIDLIYFLSPTSLSLLTERFNYIVTLFDLCHRDFMEFPEINFNQVFERRENLFRKSLTKAVKVITDSDLGKVNTIRRYGIDEERIVALPFFPSISVGISTEEYERDYFDVKETYSINGDYLFYPAQFWSHKNHIYILDALKILKEKYNKTINVVFSGSDKGNLDYILASGSKLGLDKEIHYIGFVDTKEIPYLYKQALALVMPTYFGPTNIPPLEAFKLGCPVLYSDLPGLRDQVKDAALLLDLSNPASLAEKVIDLLSDQKLRTTLIKNGRVKVEKWTEDDHWLVLKNMFADYAIKRKCWQ